MKKITICASRHLHEEAKKWKEKLENQGYNVIKSIELVGQDSLELYQATHKQHYNKIFESDILLILNLEKNGKENYIGSSVFAEIAFAIGLNLIHGKNIRIYCVNPLPKNVAYEAELKLWEKLGWIKIWEQ